MTQGSKLRPLLPTTCLRFPSLPQEENPLLPLGLVSTRPDPADQLTRSHHRLHARHYPVPRLISPRPDSTDLLTRSCSILPHPAPRPPVRRPAPPWPAAATRPRRTPSRWSSCCSRSPSATSTWCDSSPSPDLPRRFSVLSALTMSKYLRFVLNGAHDRVPFFAQIPPRKTAASYRYAILLGSVMMLVVDLVVFALQ
jgi:hypothetical protein